MNKVLEFLKSKKFLTIAGSVVLMAIIAFVYFSPDASQGRVLQQYDVQQGLANGQEAKVFAEETGETTWWTNSLFSGMPTFQISPTYSSNHLFSWINKVMGLGLPSPANLLMMMMAGMFILLMVMRMRWYVALIGAIAYGFSSYFIIIIGAGHIWKFITLAYIPPTIAGIVLAYRGRYLAGGALTALFATMQIASNHVQMTYYFMFVIAGFVIVYFYQAYKAKTLKKFGLSTAAIAVATVLAVLANLPSLYHTYEYSKETIRGNHSELASSAAAGEAESTGGLNRDYITQYSYQVPESFSLLIPNIKGGASIPLAALDKVQKELENGTIDQDLGIYLQLTSDPQIAQYTGSVTQYFGGEEGTSGPVYVGALIFALFLVGCVIVKGPVKWMLVVLTLFSIILALGRNFAGPTNFMIDYFPMYNKFRTVESILVIAEFTMPLLAILALQKMLVEKKFMKPLCIGFGISAFICLVAFLVPSVFGSAITETDLNRDAVLGQVLEYMGASPQDIHQISLSNPAVYSGIESLRYGMVKADALRSLLVIALGFAVLTLYYKQKINVAIAAGCVGVIILGDLYIVNKRYLNHDNFVDKPAEVVARPQYDDMLPDDPDMNYRVLNIPYFNHPAPSYYHKRLGGYHAAKLTRYQDMIDRHLGNFDPQSASKGDWNVVNMLNAKYILDPSTGWVKNDSAMGNAWFVDNIKYVDNADAEMNALDEIDPAVTAVADKKFKEALGNSSAAVAGDTIYETSYAPNRLTYRARTANGRVAVFSEVYFPWGWNVTIDGKEAPAPARVNYLLRAIPVPAGEHEIVMTFDPRSVHTTQAVATVSILLIYAGLICAVVLPVVLKKRRKDKNESAV